MRVLRPSILLLALVFAFPLPASARAAPDWDVSEWVNGGGTSLRAQRGKVVVIEFFQLWCPGCNEFSIPLMAEWHKKFTDEIAGGELFLVSIHTVFEGHDYQNPSRLRRFLREKGIVHLVGIDRHRDGDEIPETMKAFRTRGTPEMAIIDRRGAIRFQRFGGFDTEAAELMIQRLLDEPRD